MAEFVSIFRLHLVKRQEHLSKVAGTPQSGPIMKDEDEGGNILETSSVLVLEYCKLLISIICRERFVPATARAMLQV